MKKNLKGFTLVELIVVATILVILGTIGFASFSDNIPDARDSERKASLAKIQSAFKLYKQKRGSLPLPGDRFTISRSATGVAYQGELNNQVSLTTLDQVPVDPKTKLPYIYSTTSNKQEFQVAGTLENSDIPVAILVGDYKSVSVNILPTIMLATDSDIDIATTTDKFIFDNSHHNLPYTFEEPYSPYSDGTGFTGTLTDPQINFWQNTDYRSCAEIYSAAKSIGNGEYQILNSSGVLTNTGCTSM